MQRKKRAEVDPLSAVLDQMERLIREEHTTLEKFAYGTEAITKSTLNRLMRDRQDCKVSTLKMIAKGLGKRLVIRIE